MICMLCQKEVKGFKCSCGWKRVCHAYVPEWEEQMMDGMSSIVERGQGNADWVKVPAGTMMVVDDVEV